MKYFIIVMVLVVNMYSEIYNENDTYIKDEKRYIKSTNQLLSGVLKVNEKITGVSTITEYKYKNGLLDGEFVEYSTIDNGTYPKNFILRKGNFKNGLLDGTSYNYAPDLIGNNKSILAHSSEWKNGKKNGLDKEFYLGGYPSCENYIGNIRTEINYLNDIRKYTKVFSCNGNLYKYIYEKNSNGIIKVEEYFPNGNVEIEIPFIEFNFNNIKNSIVDGEIKVFYENGNLNALINVNKEEYMNYKNATVKVFYNNGNLGREFIVQDKKVIEGYNYTREGKKIKMTMAHLHNYSNLNSNPLILDE